MQATQAIVQNGNEVLEESIRSSMDEVKILSQSSQKLPDFISEVHVPQISGKE